MLKHKMATCHPTLRHKSKGLCSSCYNKQHEPLPSNNMRRHPTLKDMTGQTFGRLKVLSLKPNVGNKSAAWLCQCDCGKEATVLGAHLRQGAVRSCGCLHADVTAGRLKLRPYEALYNRLVSESHNRDKNLSLSYEQFVGLTLTTSCHYCCASVSWAEFNTAKNGAGYNLDRKDNDKGYHLDNVLVCCDRCNKSKADRFTYDEWMQAMTFLRERNACGQDNQAAAI